MFFSKKITSVHSVTKVTFIFFQRKTYMVEHSAHIIIFYINEWILDVREQEHSKKHSLQRKTNNNNNSRTAIWTQLHE